MEKRGPWFWVNGYPSPNSFWLAQPTVKSSYQLNSRSNMEFWHIKRSVVVTVDMKNHVNVMTSCWGKYEYENMVTGPKQYDAAFGLGIVFQNMVWKLR
jgi:hypothetical protein